MGNFNSFYDEYPDMRYLRYQFEALQLSERDVRKLYKLFRKVDTDSGGTIKSILNSLRIISMVMYLISQGDVGLSRPGTQ